MFFVFNKEKITSYIVAFSTVVILFTMSIMSNKENTIETSTNDIKDVKMNNFQENTNINKINSIKNSLQ